MVKLGLLNQKGSHKSDNNYVCIFKNRCSTPNVLFLGYEFKFAFD